MTLCRHSVCHRYTYAPDAHKDSIQGSFGVYGPGAFVQYMETHDRDSAVASIEELEVSSGSVSLVVRPPLPRLLIECMGRWVEIRCSQKIRTPRH